MNNSGYAAEQIVRMSLNGIEVAAKITGEGAKNIAMLLYTILKDGQQTKGKARLTGMLRSGKELKVFTMQNRDIQKFQKEAKRYGVLYCVLKDTDNKNPHAMVDVIARAEDASKISRIVERFNLASVDTAKIVQEAEKSREHHKEPNPGPEVPEKKEPEKSAADKLIDDALAKPLQKEQAAPANPEAAKSPSFQTAAEKSPPSAPSSSAPERPAPGVTRRDSKPSVRAEMERMRSQNRQQAEEKQPVKKAPEKAGKTAPGKTEHKQPVPKKKPKSIGKER